MQRQIESNYALLDYDRPTVIVELHEEKPQIQCDDLVLKNVKITFNQDETIEIVGEQILWSFSFDKRFVEDMNDKPMPNYTQMSYKTIWDFFNRIKKPCITSGWYQLEKTEPYRCLVSKNYVIVYK
jgi:hypothetical protein